MFISPLIIVVQDLPSYRSELCVKILFISKSNMYVPGPQRRTRFREQSHRPSAKQRNNHCE